MSDNFKAGWVAYFWSFVPTFDGQTVFTFIVGTVITLFTFWVGYKKTIGAQEERTRTANQELIASVLRRVAVERELMQDEQFNFIREAKAYRTGTAEKRLISFNDALSVVLSETIDNNFLDQASKNTVIGLIQNSRDTIKKNSEDGDSDFSDSAVRSLAYASLGLLSAVVGIFGSFLSSAFFDDVRIADHGTLAAIVKIFGVLGISFLIIGVSLIVVRQIFFEKRRNEKRQGDKILADKQ